MKEAIPFQMIRHNDENGVSGTGLVCVGAVMPSGRVAVEWTVEGKPNSNGLYQSFGDFMAVHIFSHLANNTEIRMGEWEPIPRQEQEFNLEPLIQHQFDWETDRGIDNPQYNIPRIRIELEEAAVETEPLKVLEELIDVQIILAGGMAKAVKDAGYHIGDINEMILAKLAINSIKYDVEVFQSNPTEIAVTFARHYWKVDPDEWEVGNDYY
jgi:hypothetical protein